MNTPHPPIASLLPCPFCGYKARICHNTSSDYQRHWTYYAWCLNDNCSCEFGHFKTETEAAAAWNTRANTMPHSSLLKMMESALVRIMDETDTGTIHAIAMQAFDAIPAPPLSDSSLIHELEAAKMPVSGVAHEVYNSALDEAVAIARRHCEGRSAVPGKRLELQTRDELPAYIRQRQAGQGLMGGAGPEWTDARPDASEVRGSVARTMEDTPPARSESSVMGDVVGARGGRFSDSPDKDNNLASPASMFDKASDCPGEPGYDHTPGPVIQREIRLIIHPAVLEDSIRDAFEFLGNEICPNPLACARAIMPVILPHIRTTEPDKCPDCGADMVEACSGLENITRGDAASSCRHSDYCEKPTKP